MTDKELNISLREMARVKGLCDEWYGQWNDDGTIDECLDRCVRGFDFVANNDYPPLEFSRRNFRKEDLRRHNIFLDEEVEIQGGHGFYVFAGNSRGRITFDGLIAATIYLAHDSSIEVRASGGAKVFVNLYANSSCHTTNDGWSKIKVYNRKKK